MIKLCIFDFDGTLCASHDALVHCIYKTFDHYNHPRPDEARLLEALRGGVGVANTFAELHATGLTVPESIEWRDRYRAIYNSGEGPARSYLFEGAEDILKLLKAKKIPMLLVSNKGEEAVLKALDQYNLAQYFDIVLAESDGFVLKPDPSSYHTTILPKYPHIKPEEILMIGDTPSDLGYARNIGAKACWARYGYGDHALCMAHTPDYIVDSLEEISAKGLY